MFRHLAPGAAVMLGVALWPSLLAASDPIVDGIAREFSVGVGPLFSATGPTDAIGREFAIGIGPSFADIPQVVDAIGREFSIGVGSAYRLEQVDAIAREFSVQVLHPDLAPVIFSVPPQITVGVPFSAAWTVRNFGEAPVQVAWTDRVVLSSTPDADGTVAILAEVANLPPLISLSDYSHTVEITVPGSLHSLVSTGDWWLVLVVDAGNDVAEANEEDNVLAEGPLEILVPVADIGDQWILR